MRRLIHNKTSNEGCSRQNLMDWFNYDTRTACRRAFCELVHWNSLHDLVNTEVYLKHFYEYILVCSVLSW